MIRSSAPKLRIISMFQTASLGPCDGTRRRSPRVTLRLTEDEHARLTESAAGKTVSAYIRQCLFGREVTPRRNYRPPATKQREALAEVLGALGQSRIANNLNQIAHHANRGTLPIDDATENEIKAACAQIAWIRVQLIEALGLKAQADSDDP